MADAEARAGKVGEDAEAEFVKAIPRLIRSFRRRAFYAHFMAYVVVNAGLFGIDCLAGPRWWFHWPLLGWGLGVVAHGLAFVCFSSGWVERNVGEALEAFVKLRKSRQ